MTYFAAPGINMTITPNVIISRICNYYSVEYDRILSSTRAQPIAECRHVAAYFVRKSNLPSAKVGRLINRDHATVLHSCKTVKNLIETDRMFRNKIEEIEKLLKCH